MTTSKAFPLNLLKEYRRCAKGVCFGDLYIHLTCCNGGLDTFRIERRETFGVERSGEGFGYSGILPPALVGEILSAASEGVGNSLKVEVHIREGQVQFTAISVEMEEQSCYEEEAIAWQPSKATFEGIQTAY